MQNLWAVFFSPPLTLLVVGCGTCSLHCFFRFLRLCFLIWKMGIVIFDILITWSCYEKRGWTSRCSVNYKHCLRSRWCRLPRWRGSEESVRQRRRRKRCSFNLWVGKILWSRKWQPTPVFLPRKFHGQWSPWGSQKVRRAHTCIEVREAHLAASFTCVLPRHGLSFRTLNVAHIYLI